MDAVPISLPITPAHLLILVVLVGAVCLLVVAVGGGGQGRRYDPAVEQLRIRFARDEITQAQFDEAMSALGYEKR